MEFSKEQQAFLREFVKNDTSINYADAYSPFFLSNIIVKVAEIVTIRVKYDENNLTTSGRRLEVTYFRDNPKYRGISSIFDWMHFFNYLRNNNYITVRTMGDKPENGMYKYYSNDDARIVLDKKYRTSRSFDKIDFEEIDNEEIEGLKNWSRELIYPSPKLEELVSRKFKTQEQERSTKQINKTNWALVVSVVALVVSISVETYNICKNNDTKTDPQQHKELIDAIQSTPTDTTQVKIVSPIPLETRTKKPIKPIKTIQHK